MTKIKPLGKRVLVKRSEAVQTKGGIYLPDTAQEKPREGEVIAVGPGLPDENGVMQPVGLQPGDRVLFSSYAGTPVKDQKGDEEYLILTEDDILCVFEGRA